MLLLYSLPCLSPQYRQEVKPRLTPYILPLTQVALTGSLYTVLMVAGERFLNIHRPFSHSYTVRTFNLPWKKSKEVPHPHLNCF